MADGTSADIDLGRLLFSRRKEGARKEAFVLGFFAVVLLAAAVALATQPAPRLVLAGGLAALAVGVALLAGHSWLQQSYEFACHERGVVERSHKGVRTLRYEDVDVFGFSAVRQYVNGVYMGTFLSMALAAKGETTKPIQYQGRKTEAGAGPDEFDALRDHIARLVAARMIREIEREGSVLWTGKVRLTTDSISVDGDVHRYAVVQDAHIDGGELRVTVGDRQKPILRLHAADPNFWPGLHVFEALRRPS